MIISDALSIDNRELRFQKLKNVDTATPAVVGTKRKKKEAWAPDLRLIYFFAITDTLPEFYDYSHFVQLIGLPPC